MKTMYHKGKNPLIPSDNQAREKLVFYVYEYLMHSGASKAATSFLNEISWSRTPPVGDAPGFLSSWWSVFWDLYCAAPERRDACEHSQEAKSFHDYTLQPYQINGMPHNPNAASPLGQMPPNDGLPGPGGPGMPPGGFFPHQNSHLRPSPPQQPSQQQPPHQQPPPPPHGQMIQNQAFMSPRYPGGPRPGVRMPQHDYNGPPVSGGSGPGTPLMPNQGDGGDYGGWQNPPGLGPMNHRMNPPRGQPMGPGPGPMNYGGIRQGPPPNQSMGPGVHGGMPPGVSMGGPGPGPGPGPGQGPGPGPGQGPGGRPWQPNTNMNYSSPSPANNYGPPLPGGQGSGGPGQGDGMYPVMKPGGGNMPGFPMGHGQGPDGPMGQLGPDLGPPMSSGGNGLDGMKNSPANGPGTPREDGVGVPMSDYGYGQENDQNESEAILKIKESMQEEAKKFEKDTPNDHSENFIPF